MALAPARALAIDPLYLGKSGGAGGPVLSPQVVPLFWGNWTWGSGTNTDPNVISYQFIKPFLDYLSGVGAPLGSEPVTRQYGVFGASMNRGFYNVNVGTETGTMTNARIVQRIAQKQSSNAIPQSNPNTVFLVLVKGFPTYNFLDSGVVGLNDCAYHSSSGGTYYAVVPWDKPQCGPNNPQFQRLITHELMEAMTDPVVGISWVHRFGIFNTSSNEGGDECNGNSATTSYGTVQMFADDSKINATNSFSCQGWIRSTNPRLAGAISSGGVGSDPTQYDGIYFADAAQPGGLVEVMYGTDQQNSWFIDSAKTKSFVGKPAVVVANQGQFDVFLRNPHGGITHFQHVLGSPPTWLDLPGVPTTSAGDPSAVSWGPGRIDVVARGDDGGIVHYWSNDTVNFNAETLPNSLSYGEPKIASMAGNLLDIFTYNGNTDLVDYMWNGSYWAGLITLAQHGTWSFGLVPPSAISIDSSHMDLFTPIWPQQNPTHFYFTSPGRFTPDPYVPVTAAYGPYSTSSSYGMYGAAGHYDIAWEDGGVHPAYHVSHRFPDGHFGAPIALPGDYAGPPFVLDNYIYGPGLDGCMYYNIVDWTQNPPAVYGVFGTGVCGLR